MQTFHDLANIVFGANEESLNISPAQMAVRAVFVYAVTLAFVRLGKKRLLGTGTAFDVIVGIILGSTVSRGLTGNAPLLSTLAAAAALVGMHWLFSKLAFQSHLIGGLVKGHPQQVITDGAVDRAALRRAHISDRDLEMDLRAIGIRDLSCVEEARLERDGKLSAIRRAAQPRIVEFEVADGVQKVRIEIASS